MKLLMLSLVLSFHIQVNNMNKEASGREAADLKNMGSYLVLLVDNLIELEPNSKYLPMIKSVIEKELKASNMKGLKSIKRDMEEMVMGLSSEKQKELKRAME